MKIHRNTLIYLLVVGLSLGGFFYMGARGFRAMSWFATPVFIHTGPHSFNHK